MMTDGLGPRYAFIGPLETMHLNADGKFLNFIHSLFCLALDRLFIFIGLDFINNFHKMLS